ncbi:MAG: hypothetical protein GC162_09485 [Planctomycetes bacterium]|nr:hypothetical protein [Planctomycetota bacterium]
MRRQMAMRHWVWVMIGALLGTAAFGQQQQPDTELPVTRAVLFSSGVGYFEHSGKVKGNANMELMFKADQINDVLKSMVLMDADGGNVSSVSYPSQEPIERALHSFGVDISDNPTLPELLTQLRGAQVVIEAPDRITGSILNVESKTKVIGNPEATVTEYILHLVTPTGIRSVNMNNVQSLTLSDQKLQQELNQALSLLVQSRDKDRKPVEIRFAGEGERRVRVGYLVETPIWKTSYRLDLSEKKPLLQGWAIVENTSDSDWKDVTLSLVSGRPMSFVMDLYTPLYVPRPVVVPELFASLTPKRYDEGIEATDKLANLRAEGGEERERQADRRKVMEKAAMAAAPMAPGAMAQNGGFAGRGLAMQQDAAKKQVDLSGGVQSIASAGDLGELFEYTLQHPINLSRRRSAMLPIVNKEIKAEKVSIYNQQELATHPLNGVYLTNDTGFKLMGGPVTVFDGGAYAGDAQIGHMAPDEKRLLSYAVDLAVTVDPSMKNDQEMTGVKIVRGVLYVTRMNTYQQDYVIKNKAKVKREMIIEHPFYNGRDLIEPKAYEEKTPNVYRFRVGVDAGQSGKFSVKEQQPMTQSIAIIPSSPDMLVFYINQKQIDAKVRDALAKAVAMKQELAGLQGQRNELQRQLNEIQQGQDRLRKNLASVGNDSTLGKRYITKLSEEEDTIEKLQKQIDDLTKSIDAKNNELVDYVNGLTIGG